MVVTCCDHHLRPNHASQSVPDASWQPPRWPDWHLEAVSNFWAGPILYVHALVPPDWHLEAVSNFWAGPILYVHALVPSACKLLHMSSRSQAQTLVSTGPSTHYGSSNSKKTAIRSSRVSIIECSLGCLVWFARLCLWEIAWTLFAGP